MAQTRGIGGAWMLAGLDVVLVLGTLGVLGLGLVTVPLTVDEVYPNAVFGLTLPALGAFVLSRRVGHGMGRLLLAGGTGCALTLLAYLYAQYGLVQSPGSLPAARAVGWVSSWIWVTGVPVILGLGLLLFPDGRLPGRRWRVAGAAALAGPVLLAASNALRPGPLANHPVQDNPLGLPLPEEVFTALGAAGLLVFLTAVLSALAGLAARWRRAPSEERAAIAWLLVAAAPLACVVAVPRDGVAATAAQLVGLVAVPFLPVAVGASILRHGLYGVEPLVRRSLVWWSVILGLLVVYAGSAALLDALLRGRSSAAVALTAAALVAAVSAPLRDRAQRAADRLLFGDRGDPYVALVRLGRRLGDAAGPADVLDDVTRAVAEALRAPFATVLLPDDAPVPGLADRVHQVPLTVRGEPVGRLLVGLRPGEERFGPRDVRLLDDLGRQLAGAAHAAVLHRALEASRERLAHALEEERRRMRRDLHDGLGPALTGLAFTAAAARNTLRGAPEQATALLDQLGADARACVEEVRRIAHDLRPPALDELGLPGALEAYATRLLGEGGPRVHVVTGDLPPLPAAVEVAAYRIGVEALTNVVRHASATGCRLLLEHGDPDGSPVLRVTVEDDGVGLPVQRRPGVGLAAMAERVAVLGGTFSTTAQTGGGTRVCAELPLVHA